MIRTVFTATFALALTILPVAPAAAGDRIWQVGNDSMHVYFDDLDMNSAVGRAGALARVERAADRLCRDVVNRLACMNDTVDRAVATTSLRALRLAVAERGRLRVASR